MWQAGEVEQGARRRVLERSQQDLLAWGKERGRTRAGDIGIGACLLVLEAGDGGPTIGQGYDGAWPGRCSIVPAAGASRVQSHELVATPRMAS